MDDYWTAVLWSLLPTVVVSAIFFFVLRGIIRADRTERREYARYRGAGARPARTAAGRGTGPRSGQAAPLEASDQSPAAADR